MGRGQNSMQDLICPEREPLRGSFPLTFGLGFYAWHWWRVKRKDAENARKSAQKSAVKDERPVRATFFVQRPRMLRTTA